MAGPVEKPDASAAEAIFLAAVALPSTKRSTYVASACGDNQQLRQRVEALLQAHHAPEGFLPEQPATPIEPTFSTFLAATLTEKPGDTIGRYKLREKLGEGGCGVVYLAEQEEPVRRKVALKIIKLGMDTKQVVARFEAERQALALMDHTNIAKVLEAGATETGRPYFVMELVGGIKITDYCEQNNLSTRQRLDLFIQVCHAIQHAHQKGVIHRDIKPSNVLVATQDGTPVPKVIDFGIAKATQGKLTDQTVYTAFAQFLGTPAYMSPEQAQLGGLDVDTRSDIYSLGVLLYELLTGKTPFDPKELLAAGFEAMRRTICEKEPLTPSTRLKQDVLTRQSDDSGQSKLQTPNSKIDSDLDWIVMKCLDKDRSRRYETANGLATDIERHLKNEPVVASPPSNLYRFQRMVRRNRLAFTFAGGVAATLIIGLAMALWQSIEKSYAYNRAVAAEKAAQTEAAKSEQVARFLQEMLKSVGPSVASGRDTVMMREILDKAAARVGTELANQPEVEAELRNTIGFVYWELGQYEKAELMYRQSLALLREALGSKNSAVASTLHNLAVVLRTNDDKFEEAEVKEREALAIYESLYGREHLSVGDSLHNLAAVLASRGRLDEAESAARESLAITARLSDAEDPNVGACLGQLGLMLLYQGKLSEAEPVADEAVRIFRKAVVRRQSSWSRLNPDEELGAALQAKAGLLARQGRWAESETTRREALDSFRKVLSNEHPDVTFVVVQLAEALAAQGRLADAESMLRERIALIKLRPGDNRRGDRRLASLARILQKQGKLAEAEAIWREVLAAVKKTSSSEHLFIADLLQGLASVLEAQGKFLEAEPLYHDCLRIREKVIPHGRQVFSARSLLGGNLAAQKKYAEAEPLLISGIEGLSHPPSIVITEDQRKLLAESLRLLVQICQETGRPDQSAEWKQRLAEFTAVQTNSPAPGSPPKPSD